MDLMGCCSFCPWETSCLLARHAVGPYAGHPFDRVLWNDRWKIDFLKRKGQHLKGKEYYVATSRVLLKTKKCKIAFSG
jgi:hypothetical protein